MTDAEFLARYKGTLVDIEERVEAAIVDNDAEIDYESGNDNLFKKTRLVILDILRCSSFTDLLKLMAERLSADFDASASALVFMSDAPTAEAGITRLTTASVRAALGELFAKQRTYCGALNQVQQLLLFPGQSAPIVSAAIVPLHLPDDAPARRHYGLPLLLLGSTKEQHFNSSLDTLFLDFIGEVLSVRLQGMLVAK